jgi:hypothetical protein
VAENQRSERQGGEGKEIAATALRHRATLPNRPPLRL